MKVKLWHILWVIDSVWCVHSDLSEEAELEEYPVYHTPSDSPWHCFLYPVNSDSLTFMAMQEQKHSGSPVPHRIISGILHEIQS
jgi:vacuolar protein sorting-associated protein 13A/C